MSGKELGHRLVARQRLQFTLTEQIRPRIADVTRSGRSTPRLHASVIVVPMPHSFGSVFDLIHQGALSILLKALIEPLQCLFGKTPCRAGGSSPVCGERAPRRVTMAVRLATSPATCPPMPSATSNP